jgi:four helix bundle protein
VIADENPNSEFPNSESNPNSEFRIPKQEPPRRSKFDAGERDLVERTAKFGEAVIRLAKRIPGNVINQSLISQLVRSGTSVGANYCEADDAESRKDFGHKIGLCRKEAKETKHWLRMLVVAEPTICEEARILCQEAKELNLIFGKIRRSL